MNTEAGPTANPDVGQAAGGESQQASSSRPTWLLMVAIGVPVLVAAVLVRMIQEEQLQRIVPYSLAGHLVVAVLAVIAAAPSSWFGRWLVNRPIGVLLGLVGTALVMTVSPSALGFLSGTAVSVLVGGKLLRPLVQFAGGLVAISVGSLAVSTLGVVGGGGARWLVIEHNRTSTVLPITVAVVFVVLQLIVAGYWMVRRKQATGFRPFPTLCLAGWLLLTILFSWVAGWHGELARRLTVLNFQGNEINVTWLRGPLSRLTTRGPHVMFASITRPNRLTWSILRELEPANNLSFYGPDVTDESLAIGKVDAWYLAFHRCSTTFEKFDTKHFPAVMSIHMDECPITDKGLAAIGSLSTLSSVNMHRADKITDQGLSHLARLTMLNHFMLSSDTVGDDGIAHVTRNGTLGTLHLNTPKVTAEGLKHLQKCPNLARLTLRHPITAEGVQVLATLPSLGNVELHIMELTPELVAALVKLNAALTPIAGGNRAQLRVYVPSDQDERTLKRKAPTIEAIVNRQPGQ